VSNRKKGHGSSWTVEPADEDDFINITAYEVLSYFISPSSCSFSLESKYSPRHPVLKQEGQNGLSPEVSVNVLLVAAVYDISLRSE
jgi:hypothetical protein